MPQAQKKTTSVSLTIGSSSPKTGVTTAVIQPLSVPVQQVHSPTSYLYRPDGATPACFPPVFTKELQNIAASEGQVVVLECRVRGAPPLQVKWFRQGSEIQDSPDFRILQKKPRSTAEPEEICTLVIAETFPEDAGIFTCSARNDYGSVTSTAQLIVTSANTENCNYDSVGESDNDHFQHFPPPPPILEASSFELASKNPSEIQQVNSPELGLSMAALQMQFSSAERETNGVHPSHGVNGLINGKANSNKSLPTPAVLLSPTKEPPPLLAKPKLLRLRRQRSTSFGFIRQTPLESAPSHIQCSRGTVPLAGLQMLWTPSYSLHKATRPFTCPTESCASTDLLKENPLHLGSQLQDSRSEEQLKSVLALVGTPAQPPSPHCLSYMTDTAIL
ncbi:palladin-like isoform X2 [Ailuropoda melanoleuca]|uniref:palladin-like isoform X2 n=1 Tax=Ailuropoda melanoleuca TaxID=9646 RepID=UPI0014947EA3|nr:palladin-like isoform X2 [Ailuropoda melanoleuca]